MEKPTEKPLTKNETMKAEKPDLPGTIRETLANPEADRSSGDAQHFPQFPRPHPQDAPHHRQHPCVSPPHAPPRPHGHAVRGRAGSSATDK